MEYNFDRSSHHYAELLLPLAGDEVFAKTSASDRARRSIETIRNLNTALNRLCGLPVSLRESGVKESQFEEIARTAIGDGSLIFNPEEVEFENALEIVKRAY